MDKEFQDRIDEFLLHNSIMEQTQKDEFIRELEENITKKEQYEFTVNLKKAIESRESKKEVLTILHNNYLIDKNREKNFRFIKKIIIGGSSIAAIFIIGFFLFRPANTPYNELNSTMPVFSPEKDAASGTSVKWGPDGSLNCLSDTLASDSISEGSTIPEIIGDDLSWDEILMEE